MPRCFGDGKCIKCRGRNIYRENYELLNSERGPCGFYKPFKCKFNCKLVKCFHCEKTYYPFWILQKHNGYCPECLRLKHNSSIMDKIFNSTVVY